MTVFAVACPAPKAPQLTRIFPEKKLDPAVKDMLSQDRLQHDPFFAWWERTDLDRDFWIETPSAWVRVHVVPRRAMFNPSTWRTGSTIMKDMLVATLGRTRMTECTCCSSRRWLESTVDHWETDHRDESSFPLLWIGRTVLYKQQAPDPTSLRAPEGNERQPPMRGAQEAGAAQQDDQAPTFGRVHAAGDDGAPQVDGPRAEGCDQRTQGVDRRGRPQGPDAEDQLAEPPRAPVQSGRVGRHLPQQGDEGDASQAHSRAHGHPREHTDDDRTLARMRVPGDPVGLWSLGHTGSEPVGELPHGPGPLRPVVPGRVGDEGGQDQDPRRGGGRELRKLQDRDLPRPTEHDFVLGDGVRYSGEGAIGQGLSKEPGEAQQRRCEREDRGRDGVPPGPRGSGGDLPAGDEARDLEGQGPQQRSVRFCEKGGGDDDKLRRDVCCCGFVGKQDIITEEAYVHGYVHRATNYVTDYEHHEHLGGARHSFGIPERYKKYGEGGFNWGDYSFENCAKLLRETHNSEGKANFRAIHDNPTEHNGDQVYMTYGMFTHGGVIGLTKATKDAEPIVRYLNRFAKAHLGERAAWTSLSVTKNVGTVVHRDSNNLRGARNYCCTIGQDHGGELWLESPDATEEEINSGNYVWKRDKQGVWVPGQVHSTSKRFLEFDPFCRHCSCGWSGDRWCLTFHSVRGIAQAGPEIKKYLRQCGFPAPRVGHTKDGNVAARPKTPKSTKRSIMNAAGRIGVLMATLMTAATSFLLEHSGPPVENDPIVMMEIGGMEGTLEATDLDKAVIEPIDWQDYLNPETKTNAYHFVTGISPKELRIHLDGMPERVRGDIEELIKCQIEGGEEVVLRRGDPTYFLDKFNNHVKYKSVGDNDDWVVLGKTKAGAHTVQGEGRPHEVCAVEAEDGDKAKEVKYDGSGITFTGDVPSYVQSSLRRLHQNLGHPRSEDLCRHLRLAGCEPNIVKAAKGMQCATCAATKGASIARPSTLPRLLDFNSCVGVDIMYCHDCQDKRHAFLTITDWGTSYHVVVKLGSESGPDVERAFNSHWLSPFGPPTAVSIDLDGKVQAGMARLCDWHAIKIKNVAAQGKWQGGITERQIKWFKGIWERVVHELSIDESEAEIAATLVCAAKNDLRRRCGHSPTQWVFGRSPRVPEELQDPDNGEAVTWDVTKDSKFQRLAAIRASARVAFHKAQGDDRLRRALMQRARTTKRDFDIGEPVHFWNQPKDRRRPHWDGPAVVVGKQGASYWVSRNRRCRLTAAEHLRASGPEEIGEYLTMKGVKDEVNRLLSMDPDDPETWGEGDEKEANDHLSDYSPSEFEAQDDKGAIQLDYDGDGDMYMNLDQAVLPDSHQGGEISDVEDPDPATTLPRFRLKRKTPAGVSDRGADEVMMLRRALTQRGQAKRQEKELKWSEIPEAARPLFKEAEKVQWEDHLSYDALEAMSLEESELVRKTTDAARILPCRWAYRDKNWAARKSFAAGETANSDEPKWRCKSRLVIGGHRDPDLGVEALSTDAPTLSRPGFMCMMQKLADGLKKEDRWEVAAGDIQCAFLTGGYLNRDEPLYLHQPSTGFPGLLPGQLVRIKKNIFGLATSPHEWWQDLQSGILRTPVHHAGKEYIFNQCPLDPCIFMVQEVTNGEITGAPQGYVGSHVDDLLVVAGRGLNEAIRKALSAEFPIDKWDLDHLDYIGSEIYCDGEEVTVKQRKYAETRLFSLQIPKGADDEDLVDQELRADNQSLIGALSWLSAQTRPDLTCSVSLAQQLQKAPCVADVRFTNQIASRAGLYKDMGLRFRPIPEERLGIVVYHDAAWANALEATYDEEGFELTKEDQEAGLQREGPHAGRQQRKAKRVNSKVASQMGCLTMFVDMGCVTGVPGNASIADWKSRAGQRVCRSTFGAETQASVEGLESGQYMRSFLETLMTGKLVPVEKAKSPLLCLSDCRSLFDHVHKEGIPRVPTDRRLAIDLAALRQGLKAERWGAKLPLGWVPSSLQLGDVLTKPSDPKDWWEMLGGKLVIPIDVGNPGQANKNSWEEKTSVKHKVICHPDQSVVASFSAASRPVPLPPKI